MKLDSAFFERDVLKVAPDLIGKYLVRKLENGNILRLMITETEAYRGEEDLACHASKGRTKRTEMMYNDGGHIYIYLIYGMYWMLNIVTAEPENPQAVLIRGIEGFDGPGKLTKAMKIDKTFHGQYITTTEELWIEDSQPTIKVKTSTRIGINYAGQPWIDKPWRFILDR